MSCSESAPVSNMPSHRDDHVGIAEATIDVSYPRAPQVTAYA